MTCTTCSGTREIKLPHGGAAACPSCCPQSEPPASWVQGTGHAVPCPDCGTALVVRVLEHGTWRVCPHCTYTDHSNRGSL
jgi:hypothetical protein